MIFYFSGTGNSQFVANQIASYINDKIISINYFIKNNEPSVFKSETPLIFVMPTYAWRIPKIVEKWMRNSQFDGNKNAYFVLTCGDSVGNAGVYAKKLCKDIGLNFHGLAPIIMPENYLAMFPTPDESQCQTIIKKSYPHIKVLAEQIQRGKTFSQHKVSIKGRLESGPVNLLFYPLFVNDKGFTVSKDCISCNKCVQNCPLNNIKLVSGKPIWNGNCTHCMACIACCPTVAIEYKDASKGRYRHYIMKKHIT